MPEYNRSILWIEEQFEEYAPLGDMLLEKVGNGNFITARTDEEGRRQLQNRCFDLVILDMMLPKNDVELRFKIIHLNSGLRILEDLRKNDTWITNKDCKVIAFTARGNSIAKAQIETLLGINGILIIKPTSLDIILNRVDQYLRN